MQNLFISESDEFKINFSVATGKDNSIFCDLDRSSLILSLESTGRIISNFEIEDYYATFKKPSFGNMINIYSSIFSVGGAEGGVNFNPTATRFNKIIFLIKSWNLKGKEEKPTEEDIKNLNPLIANIIGGELDIITGNLFI
jgi:hypothetical protein